NRMNDHLPGFFRRGQVRALGRDVYDPQWPVDSLRFAVGMVFQKPNPFPMSIAENVLFAPRLAGIRKREELAEILERSLRAAHLWEEVRDQLSASALSLSGGQQQRLCIARALACRPQVLLLDEPSSALDPIATARLEETVLDLAAQMTVLWVTHDLQQAARVSQRVAFLYMGELVEEGPTAAVFATPKKELTERYLTGRFG
ncbi:MAG: phosphate ABC transporter ATP-binding protein, partial [Thermoanaerobaculum sp.]|nr:phosphate ABC transporter ATP-binding protein [Thermoanaerobaculum sp.]